MVTIRVIERWEQRFVDLTGLIGGVSVILLSSLSGIGNARTAMNGSSDASIIFTVFVAFICGVIVPVAYMPTRAAMTTAMLGFAFRTVIALLSQSQTGGWIVLDFILTFVLTLLIGAIIGFFGKLLSLVFWPIAVLILGLFGVSKELITGIQEQRRTRART